VTIGIQIFPKTGLNFLAICSAVIGQKLVLLGFLQDQLSLSQGTTLWRNVIDYLTTGGPVPVKRTTWSAIKALYR